MAKRRSFLNDIKITLKRKDRLNDEAIGSLKVDDLEIKVDPNAVAAINEDVDHIHREVTPGNIKGKIPQSKMAIEKKSGVVLEASNETLVPHGFGGFPSFYHVNPRSEGVWWESRPADRNALYLIASSQMTVDVIIRG